jgi:hypothetical protein
MALEFRTDDGRVIGLYRGTEGWTRISAPFSRSQIGPRHSTELWNSPAHVADPPSSPLSAAARLRPTAPSHPLSSASFFPTSLHSPQLRHTSPAFSRVCARLPRTLHPPSISEPLPSALLGPCIGSLRRGENGRADDPLTQSVPAINRSGLVSVQ